MKDTKFKPHGDKYYVIPDDGNWQVKCQRGMLVAYSYKQKDMAVGVAILLAKENSADVIVKRRDGSVQKTYVYNK